MTAATFFWLHAIGYGLLGCAAVALLEAGWMAWRHRRRSREHGRWTPTFTNVWDDED